MSDKVKLVLVLGILAFLFGGFFVYQTYGDYLHSNPEDLVGNTTGNLNNNGLFCEQQDKIYFSNAYDEGRLYVMNRDGSDIKCLTDSPVSCINADEHHVYYYINNISSVSGMGGFQVAMLGLYRSDLKGRKTKCMDKVTCGVVKLVGNDLYYQRYDNEDGISLQKMDVRSRESQAVLPTDVNPACVYDGKIFYAGDETDHYLYAYDLNTGNSTLIYEGNVWNPDYQDGYIYYMNIDEDYRLYRYHLSDGQVEKLTDDRCDAYICCGDYIFYQKNSESAPALMQIQKDGSNPKELAEGNYTGFGVAGGLFYFSEFGQSTPMYQYNPLTDSSAQVFQLAESAALSRKTK